jgi:hypothetical protein
MGFKLKHIRSIKIFFGPFTRLGDPPGLVVTNIWDLDRGNPRKSAQVRKSTRAMERGHENENVPGRNRDRCPDGTSKLGVHGLALDLAGGNRAKGFGRQRQRLPIRLALSDPRLRLS